MGAGGAERVMSRIVRFLAERHSVVLLTWEAPDAASFYGLPDCVPYVRTGLQGGTGVRRLRRISARFPVLRRQVREFNPHVVLSFIDTMNLAAVVACVGTRAGVVVSERVDPARHASGRIVSMARWLLYPLAACTVVQTPRVAAYFPAWLRSKIKVIANPIEPAARQARPADPGNGGRFRIVSLGRLERQKGFDMLVEAFAGLSKRHPLWDLVIFGEGSERKVLAELAGRLGIGDRVFLPGLTRDPELELASSHVMAFPSRYEGFPNALGEAMAVGLPAAAFRGVSGVEELIQDGVSGILVDPGAGAAGLERALERLVAAAPLRATMGSAGLASVQQWAPARIMSEWEHVLRVTADGSMS
jgi:glycosyltransferase involved in cell wall biosynthesis